MFDGNVFVQFPGGPVIASFAEVGRVTLGSTSTNIQVTSLPNKQWYLVLAIIKKSGSFVSRLRINNDSGTNYSDETSLNGAGGVATTGEAQVDLFTTATANDGFTAILIENASSGNEKHAIAHYADSNGAGATNTIGRCDVFLKWANTSNPISEIDLVALSSSYSSGTEVVVLGADSSDTNVTPFFVEQGRNTLGSAGTTCNVTGLTAKKYMFFTANLIPTGGVADVNIRFNNDTSVNYNHRRSENTASDTGTTSSSAYVNDVTSQSLPYFGYWFCSNVSSNEKLCIGRLIYQGTAGAANAPTKCETAGKWVSTIAQITEVDFVAGSNNYNTGSEVVVYGAN